MKIKNIIFDIGNVLLRWDPESIISKSMPHCDNPQLWADHIFRSQGWHSLNQGNITEKDLIDNYSQSLGLTKEMLIEIMNTAKASLLPIDGMIEMLIKLNKINFNIYLLSDNVKEIVYYLRKQYDFWNYIHGYMMSYEVGVLKPNINIYHCLVNTYNLNVDESVFIDDHLPNVNSANKIGMYAIHFKDIHSCKVELKSIGVTLV